MSEYVVVCTWQFRTKHIGPFPTHESAEKWLKGHKWPGYIPSQEGGPEHRTIKTAPEKGL